MTDNNNFVVPQIKPESTQAKKLPCPFSPAGMLQPSHLQPPPMFGPRGSTIPPKHLAPYAHFKINRSQPRPPVNNKNFNQQYRARDSVPRHKNNVGYNNHKPRHHNSQTGNNNHTRAPQRYQKSREFWCEPCDRDFSSQELLREHNSQHQKCGIDGCKFVGHELIVTKHIQMQHSTGLYDRLKNLETPEDISKWREERKKRYPTKANIELRQQMQEERNKRGEKLTNSKARFGRSSDRKRCNNNSTDGNNVADKNDRGKQDKNKEGKKKRRRPNKKVVVTVEQREVENVKSESVNSNNELPMFRGTSQLKNYKNRRELQPKNALSSLLGAYESDSDLSENVSDDTESSEETESSILKSAENSEIDNSFEESCSQEVREVSNISGHTAVLENNLNDLPNDEPIDKPKTNCDSVEEEPEDVVMDELPSEEPIEKTEDIANSMPSKEASSKVIESRKTKTKVLDKRLSQRPTIMDLSKKYRNQNTMLEKLLQNEIRHERNVLLQCVRHIVKQEFFGIGQKPSSG